MCVCERFRVVLMYVFAYVVEHGFLLHILQIVVLFT